MRVSDPRINKQYGRKARNFDLAGWKRERESMVLIGSYANFALTPVMQSHVLDTRDRLLVETSPYDLSLIHI